MEDNFIINYNITNGPDEDRIFDAFKYFNEISLEFSLLETSRSGEDCHHIKTLGTNNAKTGPYFLIWSITRGNGTIHVKGGCDVFYLDSDGEENVQNASYHSDFDMIYDWDRHKGTMTCRGEYVVRSFLSKNREYQNPAYID